MELLRYFLCDHLAGYLLLSIDFDHAIRIVRVCSITRTPSSLSNSEQGTKTRTGDGAVISEWDKMVDLDLRRPEKAWP